MALALHPLPRPHCYPLRFARRRSARAAAASGTALVWFKTDLRLDDHPGLTSAASSSAAVVPLYIFDARFLAGYSNTMLEHLLLGLDDLKRSLRLQKSDLVIRTGASEGLVSELVDKVEASLVYAEEEVVSNACSVVANVKTLLLQTHSCKVVLWTAPLYDVEDIRKMPTSYDEFTRMKFNIKSPLTVPELPQLACQLESGVLPTLEELKQFLRDYESSQGESWKSLKCMTAEAVLKDKLISQGLLRNSLSSTQGNYTKHSEETSSRVSTSRRKVTKTLFASEGTNEVIGGTSAVLDALAAYLRYLESTSNRSWQELHEKVRATEVRSGASFYALFGIALCLGVVSRRRVYYEAIKYEKERNAGFISPFGYSTPTVAAAVETVRSMEWYWLLSLNSLQCDGEGTFPIKVWGWKGHAIEYTAIGREGPPVLLVHGFGVSLQHFHDNIRSSVDMGCRVWAITLLGFGKSEKPNVSYSELLWAELVRDFVVDVVGEPAHLVGNSIGGYIAAITAGLWPSIAQSLILINSAGTIVPRYSYIPVNEGESTNWISRLQAQLLLIFLRSAVGGIVKTYYPANAERVDDDLLDHIKRASYDPGAITVMESIFSFNLSIPLNFLFDSFGKKIFVIQGMRDPLVKSGSFVAMLREHCSYIQVKEVDAGHCPHDEIPDEVNRILVNWVRAAEVSLSIAQR